MAPRAGPGAAMNPCLPEVATGAYRAMGAYRLGTAPHAVWAGRSRDAAFRGCPLPPETPPFTVHGRRYTVIDIRFLSAKGHRY
jgi:hypothetical protein